MNSEKERRPAMLFYPDRWLGSATVLALTYEQRGMLFHLICLLWRSRTLPADKVTVERLLGAQLDDGQYASLTKCFELTPDGKLSHAFTEEVRRESAEFTANKSKGGKARAGAGERDTGGRFIAS
jgi:hypothetical protein